MTLATRLDTLLQSLPRTYQGPGGAIAILQEGKIIARHAWGFANMERRIPFTPATLHRMCSVTKQFTCAVLLDAFPDPSVLDGDVRARLPHLQQPAPTARHLAHNQSGLRDYWAVAMLHGAPPESEFGDTEAAQLISGTRTLQFEPGTRYSYVNQNFRLLSDIVQERTGRTFAELLRARVFDCVGMRSAILAADTRAMPDGTDGYEGSQTTGFRSAPNRIHWTGDAGLGASLDDMIAWEQHIDSTRDDPEALYSRLSVPVTFGDGTQAQYGFGLARRPELGHAVTSHGGALRGWRSHRLYAPGPTHLRRGAVQPHGRRPFGRRRRTRCRARHRASRPTRNHGCTPLHRCVSRTRDGPCGPDRPHRRAASSQIRHVLGTAYRSTGRHRRRTRLPPSPRGRWNVARHPAGSPILPAGAARATLRCS